MAVIYRLVPKLRACCCSSITSGLLLIGLTFPPATLLLAAGQCYKAVPTTSASIKPQTIPVAAVCRALERNLNEFCAEPPTECNFKIHPKHAAKLSFPKWTDLELRGNLSLVEEWIRAPWNIAGDAQAASRVWESEREDIERAMNSGELVFSTSRLDLYHTGKAAKVYRLDLGDCGRHAATSPDEGAFGKSQVDSTGPSVQLTPKGFRALEKRYVFLSHSGLMGHVFLFKGETFVYHDLGRSDDRDHIPNFRARVNQGINFQLNGKPTIDYQNVCEIVHFLSKNE